jgi:replicative superfamily II helicase
MRKNELVMMYKKLIKKNQEYMTEIRLQDELIQMQTLAYRRTIENIKDKIYNKINAIMIDITNGVLNGNWIYTSLENILDYINKLNRIYS